MLHNSWKNGLACGLFVILAATAFRADAFWGWRGCGCESGYYTTGALATGYGIAYMPVYDAGGCGTCWRGSCGTCTGGCETCTASCGTCTGGCGTCTGSCGTCPGGAVTPTYSAPSVPSNAPPSPAPMAPPPATGHSASDFPSPAIYRPVGNFALNSPTGTVQFSFKVPSAAKVFVNGHLTDSSGEERHYFASDLHVGYDYDFRFLVEMRRGDEVFSVVKTIRVQAGQTHQLVFTLPNGHGEQSMDRVAWSTVKPAVF